MNARSGLKCIFLVIFIFSAAFLPTGLSAQSTTGSLHGTVTDASGGVVANATVLLTTPDGNSVDVTTGKDGRYEFKSLVPGKYTVKAVAPNFALFTKPDLVLTAGHSLTVDITLAIEQQSQKVVVTDTNTAVDVDPASNAGAIVLRDKDLEALSDDPDELLTELQALAGPSAGPNGGQIYIDGFTGGELPPKASIREIRVNQNPFSAEYDKLGYGRIEILTKPGTDKFHGQVMISGNTAGLNSRNPFERFPDGETPLGYHSTQFSANVGGPLGKKASFFLNIEQRNINSLAVSSGQTVDPATLAIIPFSASIDNPQTRTNISSRLDYQQSASNTMTLRYQFFRNTETNDGITTFSLPTQGFNSEGTEHTVQFTDTKTLSPRVINETRFQFRREEDGADPISTLPSIDVASAVTLGGNLGGTSDSTNTNYELQNITYWTAGKHALKFGGRVRVTDLSVSSNSSFNGVYTFSSRLAPNCTPSDTQSCEISPIEAYQLTLQGVGPGGGGGASYYAVSHNDLGRAAVGVRYADAGLYFQDDWRIRPNITLSAGLRYETQNEIGDHMDFAPRLGLAWGIDGNAKKSAKTILRLGYGIFYDRFTATLIQEQDLANGLIQQQLLIKNPIFFDPTQTVIPTGTATTQQTTYQANNNLRTPYTIQSGVTLERQLTKVANLSVTYLNSRGDHQFYTKYLNPPQANQTAPDTILYEFDSGGTFKESQVIINSSIRMGAKLSLFGYYTLTYADSNTGGPSSIPSDPFDIDQDYGPAAFDVRHRLFFGGTYGGPFGLRFSPFMIVSSGSPFNITTGQDPYGNAEFSARPAFASCADASTAGSSIVSTPYGCFNTLPATGAALIPVNFGTGPNHFNFNLRVSKTFGFGAKKEDQSASQRGGGPGGVGTFGRAGGPGGPGGRGGRGGGGGPGGGGGDSTGRRFNLTASASVRNLFNNVNLANPIGNLSSPLFGQSNAIGNTAAYNRRIDLQLTFTF
ncbi:MAG TPA: carboxypeptidase regulatory-like domain-containing protein [Candidatus Saccharimonadales bacterium]|nr:carboxypeptidase regulatory-like domain-containing protein [Candidatus Saccharimonadales bacterium]